MTAGFEPARAEPNGLAVHRLNHSATSSGMFAWQIKVEAVRTLIYVTSKLHGIKINAHIYDRPGSNPGQCNKYVLR